MNFLLKIFFNQKYDDTISDLQNLNKADDETASYTLITDAERIREHFQDVDVLISRLENVTPEAIYLNDEAINRKDIIRKLENAVSNEQKLRGLRDRQEIDFKEGWGYPQLNGINRYLPDSKSKLIEKKFWFQFGSFISPTTWKIDKNQIHAILKQEAEDKLLMLCPSFDFSVVEGIISRLPDTIDIKDNPSWSVLHSDTVEGSRVIRKPVGIIHKITQEDSGKKDSDSEKDPEKAEKNERNIPDTSFDDIGGIDDIVTQVREVVELPLKKPELFEHMGIKPHKGVMLYGPPGCGKTMIAKAVANEINAHFISVKGPELINKYHGQSEENLRTMFEEASELQPTIIFFDEIDAVAQQRSGEDNLRTDARFVNQLLSLMDGIEDYGRICVMAATNRVELIDNALLRPGRFDYLLKVEKPNEEGCRKIFELTTRDMPVAEDFDLDKLAPELTGLSGADIAFVTREGAYNSMRRNIGMEESFNKMLDDKVDFTEFIITEEDFVSALSKIKPQKPDEDNSDPDKQAEQREEVLKQISEKAREEVK